MNRLAKWLISFLITGIILAAPLVPLVAYAPAQADSPVELTDNRTRTSKLYYLGESPTGGQRYAIDASIGSIHYQDGNGDWQDIEPDIVPSSKPNWDWEVVKGHWHLLIKDDTTVAVGKDGAWIGFQYGALAYLDYENNLYQILDERRDVTPVVEGNKITFPGIFYGCDLEYIYGNDGFKENLIITQQARDWLTNHPPNSFGLSNATTFVGGYLLVDWTQSFPAELANGTSINWDNVNEFLGQGIYFRNPVANAIVTALPIGYAKHVDDILGENQKIIRQRFWRQGGNNYLLFGSRVTELNQLPSGTIIIDPTIDEQVDNGNDDSHEGESLGNNYPSENEVYMTADDSASQRCWGGFRWELSIAKDSTIDIAYWTPYVYSNSYDDANINIHFELGAAPAQFTSDDNNITDRSRTSASVPWVEDGVGAGFQDSPSLVTPLQELVNAYSITALAVISRPNQDADIKYFIAKAFDSGSEYGAKIHIEYTAGGVSAPTVVTNSASSVEETTATLSGNITATGGENCTRWFEWDTDSGAPYSDNWSDTGTHGVGNYTHGLTSLDKGEGYYYRASANNSAGWGNGSEVFFITKPDPATSFTPTDNGTTWISLSWTNGDGMDYAQIRYSDSDYPTDNASGTEGYWGSGTTANVTGLSSSTTYYFSIFTHATENSQWSTADSYDTCQDNTKSGVTAPTVTTTVATLVEETTARLNGNITDNGSENCTRGFEWDTDSGVPYSSNWTDSGTHGTGAFNHDLTSLTKGELYYYRATANNTAGWGYGTELKFLTKPDEPTALGDTDTGTDWIAIEWTNGAGSQKTLVRYKTGAYPTSITDGTQAYFDTGTSVNVTSLDPNVTYYFRAWSYATEVGEEQYSDATSDDTAATEVDVPTVTNDGGATNVTDNDARLRGEITYTGGENPTATVFWGTSDGGTTPASWSDNASLGAKALGTFYHDITDNLTPETLYYYRMRAVNTGGTDWADSSANFTTTAYSAEIHAPTGFTLTDLGAITVNIEWTKGENSTYTLIRVSRSGYPEGITDGELVYYGDGSSANTSGYTLDLNEFFFSAWGFATDNVTYSDNHTEASIGGEGMAEIADQLGNLGTYFGMFPILLLVILAFWHRDPIMYVLAGFSLILCGFSLWIISSYLSILLVVAGIALFVKARVKGK